MLSFLNNGKWEMLYEKHNLIKCSKFTIQHTTIIRFGPIALLLKNLNVFNLSVATKKLRTN